MSFSSAEKVSEHKGYRTVETRESVAECIKLHNEAINHRKKMQEVKSRLAMASIEFDENVGNITQRRLKKAQEDFRTLSMEIWKCEEKEAMLLYDCLKNLENCVLGCPSVPERCAAEGCPYCRGSSVFSGQDRKLLRSAMWRAQDAYLEWARQKPGLTQDEQVPSIIAMAETRRELNTVENPLTPERQKSLKRELMAMEIYEVDSPDHVVCSWMMKRLALDPVLRRWCSGRSMVAMPIVPWRSGQQRQVPEDFMLLHRYVARAMTNGRISIVPNEENTEID